MLANSTAIITYSIRVYRSWKCTSQLNLQRREHNPKRSHIGVLCRKTVGKRRMITSQKSRGTKPKKSRYLVPKVHYISLKNSTDFSLFIKNRDANKWDRHKRICLSLPSHLVLFRKSQSTPPREMGEKPQLTKCTKY